MLLAAEGLKDTEIAQRLEINRGMAAKWRSRCAEHRLDGVTDEPRPGRPRTITDEQVDAVITRTLEGTPERATHDYRRAGTSSLYAALELSSRLDQDRRSDPRLHRRLLRPNQRLTTL